MRLLITGANGFLGRHVVSVAIRRGHTVRAQVRPASVNVPDEWYEHPSLEITHCDLRDPNGLVPLVEEIDAVVHLAAAKSGEMHEQFTNTVVATENLLEAMKAIGVQSIVCTSTFSVYEYRRTRRWTTLDESTPLADSPTMRDAYCQAKLIQETVIREFAAANGWRCIVLRPGVIFGRGHLWTARMGMQINERWWIRIGALAPIPLTYVENCAEAVVLAAETNHNQREAVLNIVDDNSPSLRTYLKALQRRAFPKPRVLPIPWVFARLIAALARWTNNTMFQGSAKMPGMLTPAQLHARCKPLRYSNEAIKSTLNWHPRYSWHEGLERTYGDFDPTALPNVRPSEIVTASQKVQQTT